MTTSFQTAQYERKTIYHRGLWVVRGKEFLLNDSSPNKRDEKIIAVIPAFNEAGKIGRVVDKIPNDIINEVLVIDDGSTDNTATEAKGRGATVISQKKGGVGSAIRSGIDYALGKKFDIVVILSGDDQHVPVETARVVNPIINDNYDLVQGSRHLPGGKAVGIPLSRKIMTKIYVWIFRVLTRSSISDATNGFRAFKTSIFDNGRINLWQDWLDTYELEPYIIFKAVTLNYKITEVPITILYHKTGGTTKMKPLSDWWRILRPLLLLALKIKE